MRTSVLTKKNISILTILVGLIVSIFLISLNTGTFKIPPMDVLKSLVGLGAEDQSVILFEFRMPRMVIAILVGSALAMSGAILQGLSRNPLADPGIIGINAGAGLTVVIFVYFFFGKVGTGTFFICIHSPILRTSWSNISSGNYLFTSMERRRFIDSINTSRYCRCSWIWSC